MYMQQIDFRHQSKYGYMYYAIYDRRIDNDLINYLHTPLKMI